MILFRAPSSRSGSKIKQQDVSVRQLVSSTQQVGDCGVTGINEVAQNGVCWLKHILTGTRMTVSSKGLLVLFVSLCSP